MGVINLSRIVKKANYRDVDFHGKVINDKDPEGMQRIQVRVPIIHDGIPDDKLPWVHTSANGMNAASGGGGSMASAQVPPKGTTVYHRLQENNHYFPKYEVSPTLKPDTNKELHKHEDYPYASGNVDRSGHLNRTNSKTDEVETQHVSGTHDHTDGYGHRKIKIASKKVGPDAKQVNPKGYTMEIQGIFDIGANTVKISGKDGCQLISGGDLKISAKGKLDMVGDEVRITSKGKMNITTGDEFTLFTDPYPVKFKIGPFKAPDPSGGEGDPDEVEQSSPTSYGTPQSRQRPQLE